MTYSRLFDCNKRYRCKRTSRGNDPSLADQDGSTGFGSTGAAPDIASPGGVLRADSYYVQIVNEFQTFAW